MATALEHRGGITVVNRSAIQAEPVTAMQLKKLLIEETVRQCGHEERQGQLHMSSLHLPVDVILENIRNGQQVDDEMKLKFYRGTHAEKGFQERLRSLLLAHQLYSDGPRTIRAYDGRLIGHIDASLPNDNVVIDYKSAPDKDALAEVMQTRQVSRRIYFQVQSYMLWGNFGKGFVVYETMKEGFIFIVEVRPHEATRRRLKDTVREVLERMDEASRQ